MCLSQANLEKKGFSVFSTEYLHDNRKSECIILLVIKNNNSSWGTQLEELLSISVNFMLWRGKKCFLHMAEHQVSLSMKAGL